MAGEPFRVADGITAIDTKMIGRYLVTSAYLLDATEPALVETGPATSAQTVLDGLASLGMTGAELAHIVLTHIHLDHAGGAGTLAGHFPRATVWVHDRGAPHLADPTKLVASTARAYGEDRMLEFFGATLPVARTRLRAVAGGDQIVLGDRRLDVVYTPGHASHHVALVDSRSGGVFTGDAIGVHLPDTHVLRPATPPPEFDIDRAVESIEAIRGRAGSVLLLSHFGPVPEVDAICDLAIRRIRTWGDIVRQGLRTTDDVDELAALLERQGREDYREDSGGEPFDPGAYDVLSSIKMNAAGLARYWRKKAEREAEEKMHEAELLHAPDAMGPE